MLYLCVGLILFLGIHSVNIFAPSWRAGKVASLGLPLYSGVYSLISLIGLVLIVWGFSKSRLDPFFIWHPPLALYHIASVLTLIAIIMVTAAYIPGNRIKQALGHPMALGVKVWAFAHLLANGSLGDMLLFGSFLIWAIVYYAVMRKRDREVPQTSTEPTKNLKIDLVTVSLGIAVWVVFAAFLHSRLIGVSPFGG